MVYACLEDSNHNYIMNTNNSRTILRRSSIFEMTNSELSLINTNKSISIDNTFHQQLSNIDKEDVDKIDYIRNTIDKLSDTEWIFVPEGFGESIMIPMPNISYYFSSSKL